MSLQGGSPPSYTGQELLTSSNEAGFIGLVRQLQFLSTNF